MAGKYLLDTNAAIALLNRDPLIIAKLSGDPDLYLPLPVIGELYFGAHNSSRIAENLTTVASFISANAILDCEHATALAYGQVKADVRAKGRPIPDNDLWIAAIAQQYGLTLVTRDHHFQHVTALSTISW